MQDIRKFIIITGGLISGFMPIISSANSTEYFFNGTYLGATMGGAWGTSDYHTNPGCPALPTNAVFCNASPDPTAVNGTAVANSGKGTLSSTSFIGGIEGGHNWQIHNFVVGGEADFSGLHLNKSLETNGIFPSLFLGNSYVLDNSFSTDWLATIRGRAGVTVTPKLLFYATGGVAFVDYDLSSSYQDNAISPLFPGGTGTDNQSGVKTGWTVGGGGEFFLSQSVSVKLEYLYMNFGTTTFAIPVSNTPDYTQTMHTSFDMNINLVRLGLNYQF